MSELPPGWVSASLGDLCSVIRGVTYKKHEALFVPTEGFIPLVTSAQISERGLDLTAKITYVPAERVSDAQRLARGDIVVATSSGSASVVGKSAMVSVDWPGTFGAFCAVLRPTALVDPAYVAYYVGSSRLRRRWSELAAGTNINNLKRKHLVDTLVRLPPRNEQSRIVAAVEEQFSRLDAAEPSLRRASQRLQSLRKRIRSFAVGEGESCRVGDLLVGIEAGKSFKCDNRACLRG
jgi:type I restriction enzyme, S subunit